MKKDTTCKWKLPPLGCFAIYMPKKGKVKTGKTNRKIFNFEQGTTTLDKLLAFWKINPKKFKLWDYSIGISYITKTTKIELDGEFINKKEKRNGTKR